MSTNTEIHRIGTFSWREAALWGTAGLVVIAIYAGGGLAFLRAKTPSQDDAKSPEAIMVDLAPAPTAPPVPEESTVLDDHDAREVKAAPTPDPQPAEEAAPPETRPDPPEPTQEEPPPPESQEPEPPKVETPKETPPHETSAEVPLPAPRPTPPPQPSRRLERPKKAHRPAPSRAARRASIRTEQADRPAARQTSKGTTSSEAPARWQARLLAHLERRKRYPGSARAKHEEGTAYVRFRIDGSGNVLSVAIARSSGFADLDAAVVDMMHRASPVPAPPPGVKHTIIVPIRFNLR